MPPNIGLTQSIESGRSSAGAPFLDALLRSRKRREDRENLNIEFSQAKELAKLKQDLKNNSPGDPINALLRAGKSVDALQKIDPEGRNPKTVELVEKLQKFGLGQVGDGGQEQAQAQKVGQAAGLSQRPQIKDDQGGIGLNVDPKLLSQAKQKNIFGEQGVEGRLAEEQLKTQVRENVPEKLSDAQLKEIQKDVKSISKLTDSVVFFSKNMEEFSDLLGPVGTLAPIKRFASKFDPKGGSEQAFISAVEQSNQASVRALTGAQAGFTELQFLRGIHPTVDDKPQQFLNKSYFTAQTTINGLKRQIPLLENSGRDVSGLNQLVDSFDKQLQSIEKVMEPKELQKLRIQWQSDAQKAGIELSGEGKGIIMEDSQGNKALVDPETNQVIREIKSGI